MDKLQKLPPELLLEIVYKIDDPPSLLALTHTSARLYTSLSLQREVWLHALRTTCDAFGVFEPTYSTGTMDLPTIRKSALDPWFSRRRIASGNLWDPGSSGNLSAPASSGNLWVPCSSGRRIRELQILGCTKLQGDENQWHGQFIGIHVVPGGRYIVGLTFAFICLWDMGDDADNRVDGALLCTESIGPKDSYFWGFSRPISHLRDRLRFVAHLKRKQNVTDSAHQPAFHVYEVGPFPASREVRVLARLEIGSDDFSVQDYWLCGEQVFIHINDRLIVWNFVRSLLVSWSLGLNSGTLERVTVGDKVVFWKRREISIFELPSLAIFPEGHTFVECPNEVLNERKATIPWDCGSIAADLDGPVVCSASQGYDSPRPRISFEAIVTNDEDGKVRIRRHHLKIPGNLDKGPIESPTLEASGTSELERIYSSGLLMGTRLSLFCMNAEPHSSLAILAHSRTTSLQVLLAGDEGSAWKGTQTMSFILPAPMAGYAAATSRTCVTSGCFAYVSGDNCIYVCYLPWL